MIFEGGNFAHDGINPASAIDDLQLLTTHYRPNVRLFEAFGDTSGAAALGANLAADVMAAQPTLWPETVRGLMVRRRNGRRPCVQGSTPRVRRPRSWRCFAATAGASPGLDRALLSAANDATLMVEDALLPFRKDGSQIKTRDMNLHRLPWPRDELAALGEMDVELRITLSYFVEPNPGERGWTRRHRYASHSLRFAVKRSLESIPEFRGRINKAAQDEEAGAAGAAGGANWVSAKFATADRCIPTSGGAARRPWPSATPSACFRSAAGGRKSRRCSDGTARRAMRS